MAANHALETRLPAGPVAWGVLGLPTRLLRAEVMDPYGNRCS
jgi:hypothetical protein